MGPPQWKSSWGEDASVFAVELVKAPPAGTIFSQMEPGQFSPPQDAPDNGAPLAALRKLSPATAEAVKEE